MANVSSSNSQKALVPKLRFPGFEGEWHTVRLSDFTDRITRKNSQNESDLPLTISSKDGLVDQISYFNKTVASKDMSGYYLLLNGEFAYNKSYSVGFDFGSIKRLDRYPMGALSTLYICFSVKNYDSDFIKTYFDSLKWYKEIYMIAAEGARNHGLLNVPTEDFFATRHTLPTNLKEQKKIAAFMKLLERRIDAQRCLVEALKSYKRGLLQSIFMKKICNGFLEDEEWKNVCVGDILEVKHGRDYKDQPSDKGLHPVVGTGGQICKIDTYLCDWPCVCIGRKGTIDRPQYFDIPFWSVDTLFYTKPKAENNPRFQYYLFETIPWATYNEASGVPSLSASTIEQIPVKIPSKKTQDNLARFLSAVDGKIEISNYLLAKLFQAKQGLLQQIFI